MKPLFKKTVWCHGWVVFAKDGFWRFHSLRSTAERDARQFEQEGYGNFKVKKASVIDGWIK